MQQIKEFIENRAITFTRFGLTLAAALFLIGSIGTVYAFCDKGERVLNYDESASKIDYRVNLLPNNSYAESYIQGSANRSYPTSLINTIDLDYNYTINFDQPVVGDLTYQLVAVSNASKVEGSVRSEVWTSKPAEIADKYTLHIDGQSADISATTKLTYENYVAQLRVLEADARGVALQGSLNVALVISGQLKPKNFAKATDFGTRLDFTIPVASNSSVEAKTAVKNNSPATMREIPDHMDFRHVAIAFFSILVVLLSGAVLVAYIYADRYRNHKFPYEENVRKLLSAYDGIIVSIKKAPAFRGVAIADVDDFDQLLDVYNSIHLPINHYKVRDTSYFVIVDNSRAWRYSVSKKDFKPSEKTN